MQNDTTLPFKVSYAQNREDILLEGILKDVKKGFYVDIGANHPTLDSVTKIFYDKGWHGINVEPSPVLFEVIDRARLKDINLNIGIGEKKEKRIFRFYKNGDGLSTFSPEMMAEYEKSSNDYTADYEDSEVQIDTLSSMLAKYAPKDIHFMKVDVEGFEYEVLHGNDWKKFRPWVICIEATHIQHSWDKYLKDQNYTLLLFDGLNNYYIAKERQEIGDNFSYALTIFPTPILAQQAALYVKDLQKSNIRLSKLVEERAALLAQIDRLRQELARIGGVKGSIKNTVRAFDRAALVYIEKLNKPKIKKTTPLQLDRMTTIDEARKTVRLYDLATFYQKKSSERTLYRAVSSSYKTVTRTPVKGIKSVRRSMNASKQK